MIWPILLAAVVLAPAQKSAPRQDAGISFFSRGPLQGGERIRFRAEGGAGWVEMPVHVGPVDKGMYSHPLYDVRLSPGGRLTVESSLVRRGKLVAQIKTKLRIGRDRRYMVYAAVQPNNPTHGCMGCYGVQSAAIARDPTRRLWVYYSFNGISGPIIF